MSYAFKVSRIIKGWYNGKVFSSEYSHRGDIRCEYSILNCVVVQGLYCPNIYIDVKVSKYYIKSSNNNWIKMLKPVSRMIRDINNNIRWIIVRDKKMEFNIFGIDDTDYKIKVRNIKWDISYGLGSK